MKDLAITSSVEIMNIKNIRCYLKDNIAYLKLEDVARGLGFITVATSGNEIIRWVRVDKYLADITATQVSPFERTGFIPENIFYKLCMKANNETAKKFQDLVCDDILPTIRKNGAYLTDDKIDDILSNPDTIIKLATKLKEERQAKQVLEHKIQEDKPKVEFANAIAGTSSSIEIGTFAKVLYDTEGIKLGRNKLFKWLRDKKYLTQKNEPYQTALNMGLMVEEEKTFINSKTGTTEPYTQPRITGKGQLYFTIKLKEEFNKGVYNV